MITDSVMSVELRLWSSRRRHASGNLHVHRGELRMKRTPAALLLVVSALAASLPAAPADEKDASPKKSATSKSVSRADSKKGSGTEKEKDKPKELLSADTFSGLELRNI